MTTFAEQHLERWASFAELSTKRGKIVPQRPTIKVKLFSSTHFSFWSERVCWCVFVVEKERDPRPGYTVKLYPVADSNIRKKQTRCSLPCNFSCMYAFSSPALLKLLDVVIPCFVENVRTEHERQVVMGILESMNSVIKSCKEEVFVNSAYLKEISHLIRDVLKKKVSTLA